MVTSAGSALLVGVASTAFATPAYAPTASVFVSEMIQPWLHGVSNSAGSGGAHTLHFYARTVGSATWDLLNDQQVTGTDEYAQVTDGQLSIGQAFEYQVKDCDSTGCLSSAVQTGHVSPALGAGERSGATRVPFTIGDKIAAQVDVGSGNLLVTTTQFSLPRRNGSTLDVGLAYNSVTRTNQGEFDGSISDGWRLSTAADIRLAERGQLTVTYYGPNGLTGTFWRDDPNGAWTPPPGFKMDLTAVSAAGR
ncbi:MAG: hypothetical protein JWP40_858 [Blastococcus sp.]|nr:hypothetical protein [Blastococcus sp.]